VLSKAEAAFHEIEVYAFLYGYFLWCSSLQGEVYPHATYINEVYAFLYGYFLWCSSLQGEVYPHATYINEVYAFLYGYFLRCSSLQAKVYIHTCYIYKGEGSNKNSSSTFYEKKIPGIKFHIPQNQNGVGTIKTYTDHIDIQQSKQTGLEAPEDPKEASSGSWRPSGISLVTGG
jgi:hypothetical protein